MNKDTRKALERLESALLAEEAENPEDLDDFLDGLLDEPTDSLASTGPVTYNNFANGYGRQEEDEPSEKPESLNGLLFAAAGLLVGIGAMIVYWVVRFL